MPKVVRKCRVCGKEYEACPPPYMEINPYRWQDVACCVEHGMEYFEMIEASRSSGTTPEVVKPEDGDAATSDDKTADKKKSGRK